MQRTNVDQTSFVQGKVIYYTEMTSNWLLRLKKLKYVGFIGGEMWILLSIRGMGNDFA